MSLRVSSHLRAVWIAVCLVVVCAAGRQFPSTVAAQEPEATSHENQATEKPAEHLILVLGAPGEPEFGEEFRAAAERWLALAHARGWRVSAIGEGLGEKLSGDPPEGQSIKQQFEHELSLAKDQAAERLWIVLIGHGTFNQNKAKFNLAGPDLAPEELAGWLEPIQYPIVLINCASASAPFQTELAAKGRVVVTATKSGTEYNYARFGKYLAMTIQDDQVDLDHDREVSLLEAFLAASNRTEKFYAEESRLATEHALLNDNGDAVGTTADFYRGVRPVKSAAKAPVDGSNAARIILYSQPGVSPLSQSAAAKRVELESALQDLRLRKSELEEADYYQQLEQIFLGLAELYRQD